jgi:hypothetical protein
MRAAIILSFVAASVVVKAQDIDFEGVDAAPDPVINIIPGLLEQVVPFDEEEAVVAVESQVAADPLQVNPVSEPTGVPEVKRHLKRAACDKEIRTANDYKFDLSSANKFRADISVASVATGAATPSGYFNTFTNLQVASSAHGFLGYWTAPSYNPSLCAAKCDSRPGCLGFNICGSLYSYA